MPCEASFAVVFLLKYARVCSSMVWSVCCLHKRIEEPFVWSVLAGMPWRRPP